MSTTALYRPNLLILGPSGSGKSSCYRNLPPDKTEIIDVELKGFPFRTKFPRVTHVETVPTFYPAVAAAVANPANEIVVIDSIVKHFENALNFCRASYKNFDIWSNFNMHIRNTVNACKSKTKIMVAIGLDDFVDILAPDGSKTSARRAATLAGKEWEGKVEKDFLMVLYTDVRKDLSKNPPVMKYQFLTNSDGICSAKSPADMFPQYVENDLNIVLSRVKEYYQ